MTTTQIADISDKSQAYDCYDTHVDAVFVDHATCTRHGNDDEPDCDECFVANSHNWEN